MAITNIAERINKRARELGLTQTQIAKETEKTKGAVNQWFKGATKPNGSNLLSLAKALKTSAEWLESGVLDKDHSTPTDLNSLISVATPTYLKELERLQQANDQGILDEADKQLIKIIADKYIGRLK